MIQSAVILEKDMEVPQPLIESIYAGLCAGFDSCKKQSVSRVSVSEPSGDGWCELDGSLLWGVGHIRSCGSYGFCYVCWRWDYADDPIAHFWANEGNSLVR